MDLATFFIRLLICFILSILIGLERQLRHRMVGLRTNVLVCIGAFLFVYLSFGINVSDQTRIAAQVVSGIGFLGAGVILRDGSKIKGLNTAATLWCVAAIGTLCASGLVIEATIGTIFVLLSNVILRLFSLFIMGKVKASEKEKYIIRINCKKTKEEKVRTSFAKTIDDNDLVLNSLERSEITEEEVKLKAIMITSTPSKVEMVINKISTNPGVVSITWEHEKVSKTDNEDSDEE
ncbi:MAG: MgtC/SapB family protein [Candidatus Aphodocola sp.]